MINKFIDTSGIPSAVIFMSGSGTNAEKLLLSIKESQPPSWKASAIVTDAPKKSRAAELAKEFSLPLISLDIKEFYLQRGESRVSILTERGQQIREEWTKELRLLLKGIRINFGILAGFVPLTNIITDFPCLNVHPGDLTIEENGKRILAGLHTIPIETAILKGFTEMRSSVIIAQAYTGSGGEMDTGPILGISAPVKIDLQGKSLVYLKEIADKRPKFRRPGSFRDELDSIAEHNQRILKENGDWIVFPPVVHDFASGFFGHDEKKVLHYFNNGCWMPVKTVIYGKDFKKPVTLHNINK